MQENTKQVAVKMTARRCFRTEPIYQYDVGHVLNFEGFELPASFEVHFSRSPMGNAITQIGADGICTVPDMFAQSAGVIYAWLYIADADTGLTKYEIEIPVAKRAKITDQQPTPVEQSAIDQAIAALNAGVEAAEDAQEAAEAAQASAESYAESAGQSAITATNAASSAASAKTAAETAARNAETSATDAHASREAADQSATNAGVSERAAAGSASAAASSASAAAQSASNASGAASSASESAGAAVAAKGAAETAQAAAEAVVETVTESADAAAESATTASGAATNAAASAVSASSSATAAAGSATAAAGSATSAGQSATAAAGSASDAAEIKDYLDENYGEISNDVNSLKSAFNTVDNTIFDITEINSVPCSQIPGATMKNGSSARSTSYITIDALTTYDSYYKVVTEPTTIWFEDTSSAYISICVGESYTQSTTPSEGVLRLYCSNSVRYRKSENNLPTRENPITVPAGGVFVVTVTAGGNDLVYGVVHSVTRQVSSNFAEEVKEKMPVDGVRVELTDTTVILHGDKYNVTFTKKTTTQGYQWNITSLSGKGGNVLPNSTDIIGVIQFDGENNFMGGAHGNESNTAFSIWADGEQVTEDGTYENVKIWMVSNLYSVNDPTANVVDRYVMFNFDKNGWKCRNTFKILTRATVKVSYASGLFGFNLSDVDFASCNLGPIPLEAGARLYYKAEFKQVFVNFPNNLSVTFRSNTSALGFITFRTSTNSWKAYFADVTNQAFSNGDYITGESEYIF